MLLEHTCCFFAFSDVTFFDFDGELGGCRHHTVDACLDDLIGGAFRACLVTLGRSTRAGCRDWRCRRTQPDSLCPLVVVDDFDFYLSGSMHAEGDVVAELAQMQQKTGNEASTTLEHRQAVLDSLS